MSERLPMANAVAVRDKKIIFAGEEMSKDFKRIIF